MRVRIAILGWIFLACATATVAAKQSPQAPAEVLNNESVVAMVVGKVPKDLILAKIQNTWTAFDVTAKGVVGLYQNKVPTDIIKVMVRTVGTGPSNPAELMTNEGVVLMVTSQLPKDLILAKIQASRANFDLTTNGLVALSQNKVSQDVVKAMMAAQAIGSTPPASTPQGGTSPKAPLGSTSGPAATHPAPPAGNPPTANSGANALNSTPSTPASDRGGKGAAPAARTDRAVVDMKKIPTEPGIYMYSDEGKGLAFVEIEPSRYTASKFGSGILTGLTYGVAKTKIKASLRGTRAALQSTDASADFYFVFDEKTGTLTNANPSSPNEFSLIRFDVTSSAREVVVSEGNAYGTQTGTDDKATVPFTSTKLARGVYRVAPNAALAKGEFAFMTASAAIVGAASRLFDFGIQSR